MSNFHFIASLHPENIPEIEAHELGQNEFVKNKVEDENDFGYICRYHEQYIEESPDIQENVENISEHITNAVWMQGFWDRADALVENTSLPYSKIWDDAYTYAERRVAELENY